MRLKKIIEIRKNLLEWINVSKKQIDYFSFWVNWKTKEIYKIFTIKQKNWKERVICEPTPLLKIIQEKILEKILNPYFCKNNKEYMTGFILWKSIKDNAKFHTKKKIVVKIDLKDFFPSISTEKIFIVFYKMLWYNYNVSKYLAWLCTYKNQIPQWSPTSPALSNMVAKKLDARLYGYLKAIEKNTDLEIEFSRYADDITISFNKNIWSFLERILETIIDIIEDEWFDVNYKKLQIITSKNKQKVTWLVVNDKISIWRENYRFLRLIVYVIKKYWFEEWIKKRNQSEDKKKESKDSLMNAINWKILFLKMVNPELAEKIYSKRKEIKL